jgi:hypothetical protein
LGIPCCDQTRKNIPFLLKKNLIQSWWMSRCITCSLGGGRWVRGMNGWFIDGSRFLIQSFEIFWRALRSWCRLGLAG